MNYVQKHYEPDNRRYWAKYLKNEIIKHRSSSEKNNWMLSMVTTEQNNHREPDRNCQLLFETPT